MRFTAVIGVIGGVACLVLQGPATPAHADPVLDDTTPGQTHSPAPPPMPGPPAVDLDGVYAVGTEMLPGIYASAGPTDGGTCYWRRIGAGGVTVDNALTKQPQIVAIEATDVAFKTRGCQAWQPTTDTPPGQTPPWLSQMQFRHNLDILNGLAGQSGNGLLPPY